MKIKGNALKISESNAKKNIHFREQKEQGTAAAAASSKEEE